MPPEADHRPLRSVHTQSFPALLRELGIALAVSTYQSGKLILVRADADTLNTHFREFPKPMGLAADAGRLAMGTGHQVVEFCNVPAVCARLDPPDRHDACYVPRRAHVTGGIDIHEMAYAGNELWFVNTLFSCLCTIDAGHSFVPRWRPPFVTAYELSDRCHLNGLGLRDGRARYVTALGETDSPQGWRAQKANGGIVMDIETDAIVSRGLSMPHSPRWHGEHLWVLESGLGTLSRVNEANGERQTVATLPGFTRGLDFHGPIAFVGLSQVRETVVFSGIPVTERVQERNCGVWAVNTQTGEVLGFLRFEESVQEVFAVTVLPQMRYPELLTDDHELIATTYVLPDAALAEVAERPSEPIAEPDSFEDWLARGDAAFEHRDLEEAGQAYARCLELEPERPVALYNASVVDVERERWPEAHERLETLLALDGNHAQAHNNLGIVGEHTLNSTESITHFRKAIELAPDFADAHFNLGMALLKVGQLEEGFRECEWRWQTSRFTPFECPHPLWDGSDISDKRLLIHTEQGMGDAMQFVRYLPLIARRCRHTIVACPTDLMPLFEDMPGIGTLRGVGAVPLDSFDVYVPLMSLPHLLGTTLDTIPAEVPYLTKPPARDASGWFGAGADNDSATPRGADSNALHVGFVWAGSATHRNDHNRSCRLEDWFDVLRTPAVTFVSLQRPVNEIERAQLRALGANDASTHLKDFGDTAAAIDTLDLVISVDTSVAHLAGAMGKRVWTLLSFSPDWRWLLK